MCVCVFMPEVFENFKDNGGREEPKDKLECTIRKAEACDLQATITQMVTCASYRFRIDVPFQP